MPAGSLVGSEASPRVAVAVVSWNTRDLLRRCLTALEPDAAGGRAEVWVVDNASSDGSASMVREEFPWVRLIAAADNLGFGPAANLVAERTTTPWLAVANADTEPASGTLSRLLSAGQADPRAGLVAPRLILDDGTTQHSVYCFPTVLRALLFNLGLPLLTPRLADRLLLEGRWNPERPRRVDWAVGAFLLVRRAAWAAVGGFDPRMWMYAEDLDLAWRAAAAGWHTRYEPAARVAHVHAAAASQQWGDDRDARWVRSTYAWMLRRRGPLRTRAYGIVNTLGAALWATVASLRARSGDEELGLAAWKLRRWARLHLANTLARRSTLERHR